MEPLAATLVHYVEETRRLAAHGSTTEGTYYPAIRDLIVHILRERRLPFEVRTGTSEARAGGSDFPDFTLADRALFVGVFGEVKRPGETLEAMASSTERADQIGRYLARTGTVLLSNVRGFGLLVCAPGYERVAGTPVPPSARELVATVDLWSALSGSGAKARIDAAALAELVELVDRAVTDHAPIADPPDLAKVLARQARDAEVSLPEDLRPVTPLLDDYRQALGLAFELGDPKGDRFFRSSLVQTVFYSLFAAWILWDRWCEEERRRGRKLTPEEETFDLEKAQAHLRLPFLEELFYDLRRPHYLQRLDLRRHLDRAVATLNRVDRRLFRQRLNFPTIDNETPAVAAITYFYEPFLEAFDPELRARPRRLVHAAGDRPLSRSRRVHHLLKTELGIGARARRSRASCVLDPCCGTGAYLARGRPLHRRRAARGGRRATLTGQELRSALHRAGHRLRDPDRTLRDSTAPAPHSSFRASVRRSRAAQRLAVYLTNALTGWHDPARVKLTFPEMREEFTASQGVKQDQRIIVVLGNPPYDRFAGIAQAEEAELVAHYKGVELVIERDSEGKVAPRRVRPPATQAARPEPPLQGVRCQEAAPGRPLHPLHPARRAADRGGGRPRHRLLHQQLVLSHRPLAPAHAPFPADELPRSLDRQSQRRQVPHRQADPARPPGCGHRRPERLQHGCRSARHPARHRHRHLARSAPNRVADAETAVVLYRDLWGLARWKRQALLASLPAAEPPAGSSTPMFARIAPSPENRWRLSPQVIRSWLRGLAESRRSISCRHFRLSFSGRGLAGSWIDTDQDTLCERI